MSVEVPLRPLAEVLEAMTGHGIQGQKSLSSAGAVALTLLAILMLVGSSLAATTAPPPFFMLPWRRAADSGRPLGVQGTSWYKGWSGMRAPPGPGDDKTIVTMVYYHEQTIAVVELGKQKTLRNCELIEVYDDVDIQDALRNLSSVAKPFEISFTDMMDLMGKCHELRMPKLERVPSLNEARSSSRGVRRVSQQRGLLSNAVINPFSIFNGIVPGTKWCGTGDIAKTYYDLGVDHSLDRCCRTHDLCPVKIRAYQTRYNVTNGALFSKSHCDCDDTLFRCLKNSRSSTADVLGNIYFNIVQVPCLEHVSIPSSPDGNQEEPMRFTSQRYAY